ncbi:hypothetical protein ACFL6Y_02445 [Elusimicrobiota bacterium]
MNKNLLEYSWKPKVPANLNTFLKTYREPKDDYSLGFLRPTDAYVLNEIEKLAKAKRSKIDDICLIGIGGSSLPAQAMHRFFTKPNFNCMSRKERGGSPRFWVFDSIDPDYLKVELEQHLKNPRRTLIHVVSKSGQTLESEIVRDIVVKHFKRKMGDSWKKNFITTVEPSAGNPLFEWAVINRIPVFPLDADIEGRFSSLTPVALVSAAFLGLPIRNFWAGAKDVFEKPAGFTSYAQWLYSAYASKRKNVGFYIYGEELSQLGALLLQLFSESLGKDGKGLTPLIFHGSRDQHSMLQLYLDGPKDKVVTLLTTEKDRSSAAGKGFWASEGGVIHALNVAKVPNVRIKLSEKSPQSYAALIKFFHMAIYAVGHMLKVHPFNQPMVELQKIKTKQLMKKK